MYQRGYYSRIDKMLSLLTWQSYHCILELFVLIIQRIVEEFEYQGKVMNEMNERIRNYEIAGKKEAANRLKEQLVLLEVSIHIIFEVFYVFSIIITNC